MDFLEEAIDEEMEPAPVVVMPVALEGELMTAESEARTKLLRNTLEGQHAMHGILGAVYEKNGGENWFAGWAKNHEGAFFKLMFSATPGMQPTQGFQGDLNLHIHHSLAPSPLDD